jgi:hypothetical protein
VRCAGSVAPSFALLIYLLCTGGNAGLELPIRIFPVSLVLAGAPRTGGNAGLELPILIFPVSLVLAGPPRTGGNAGLELPMRTRPLSETAAGLSFALT